MHPRLHETLFPTAFLLFSVLALGLSSCAGRITKADCEKTDFYEMGLQDGKDGKSTDRLARYESNCQAHGVTVPSERYTYGRQVGLADYCDAKRGERDAKKAEANAICVQAKVPPYQTGYSKEAAETRGDIQEEMSKLQKSKDEIQVKQNSLKTKLDTLDQQQSVVE